MTDFEITFQDDELLYGDYENMSLISKYHVLKVFTTIKRRLHNLLNKVYKLHVAKETYQPL